jgi:plastocyanin
MPGTRKRTGRGPQARRVVVLVCAVALAVLAGCGSSGGSSGSSAAGSSGGSSSSAAAGSGASTAVITIKDFAFTTPTSVPAGAKITVHNMDSTAHTVTADSGNAFDSQAPSGNSSFTAPSKPGSYPFHCSIHPEMHGTLVVS